MPIFDLLLLVDVEKAVEKVQEKVTKVAESIEKLEKSNALTAFGGGMMPQMESQVWGWEVKAGCRR